MAKRIIILLMLSLLMSSIGLHVFAQNEKPSDVQYIEFEKQIDDRTGKLSPDDIRAIEGAASEQQKKTGLRAFVLIIDNIPSWTYDEFAREQFHDWKKKGIVDDKSYLFLISTGQKKLQVVRGDYILKRETGHDIVLLKNRLTDSFSQKKYADGIISYIEGLNEIPSLKSSMKSEKNMSKYLLFLTPLVIPALVLAFLVRKSRLKAKEKREEEKRKKEAPYVE